MDMQSAMGGRTGHVTLPVAWFIVFIIGGFPGGSDGKESACNQETRVLSPGWEDSLEKGMATHSSNLAWKIPRREEPGRLQSMGSQKVRRN